MSTTRTEEACDDRDDGLIDRRGRNLQRTVLSSLMDRGKELKEGEIKKETGADMEETITGSKDVESSIIMRKDEASSGDPCPAKVIHHLTHHEPCADDL